MLQALRWDHIWDVRIDAQPLFQPVAVDRRRRAQRCAGKRASVGSLVDFSEVTNDLHGNIKSPLHDVFRVALAVKVWTMPTCFP